jgi:hypothetical protein
MDLSFERPLALLLAGLALPLVAVFLARARRVRHTVPHLRLWMDLRGRRERRRRFLEEMLSLALLLGALFTLTLSAAGLGAHKVEPVEGHYIFVVDVSPSMAAGPDQGPSRISRAVERCRACLRSAPPLARILLMTTTGRIAHPFSSDRDSLGKALSGLRVDGSGRGPGRAVRDARALLGTRPRSRILCFTDQDPPPGWDAELGDWFTLGTPLPNLGITGLHVPALPWWETRVPVSFEVFNSGPADGTARLSLSAGDEPAGELSLRVPARETVRGTLPLERRNSETRFVLRLRSRDGLAADDAVFGVLPRGGPRRMIVVSENPLDAFMASAVEALGDLLDLDATRVFGPDDFRSELPEADLTVYSRGPDLPEPPGPGLITFGRPPTFLGPSRILASCSVEGQNPFHPVTAGLSLDGVFFLRAHSVEAGSPLFRTEKGVVAAAFESPSRREVAFGFTLENTNLPVKPAFPLLLRNAVRWVLEDRTAETARHRRWAEASGGLRSRKLPDRPGHHPLGPGGRPVGVNLLDRRESDLWRESPARPQVFHPLAAVEKTRRPLGPLLAGLGLVFLLAEALRLALTRPYPGQKSSTHPAPNRL